ncbi:Carcinine transporter, partial [Pseudolycoriella hygida]
TRPTRPKPNVNRPAGREFVNKAFEVDKATIQKIKNNQKPNEPKDTINVQDFDDLIPHIGGFGRYQKILFLLMIPYAYFLVFVYFTQIFITLVPEEHWCAVPELAHLSVEERVKLAIPIKNNVHSKCSVYDVDFNEQIALNDTEDKSKWKEKPCSNGWEYSRAELPYSTITTDLNWVCDNDTLPTIAQSVFFIGAICGGLLLGWIADRYGRVPSLMVANTIGAVAGIATAFTNDFWSFTACRFFVGFAFDNCFTIMYILGEKVLNRILKCEPLIDLFAVLEYVGPKYRTFIANMSIAVFFGSAACAIPWIAYYVSDWKLLSIYTSAPLLLALFTPFVVPESARWLVSKNKIDRALIIIKKFERINGKTIKPEIYQAFVDSCARSQSESDSVNYSIIDLFKKPRLRKITCLLILFYMAISLVFDGYVRNIESIGLSTFIAFTVASATELPASVILTLTLDRWGRRWLGLGTMFLCGVCSVIASFLPTGTITIVLIVTGRFFVNFSYNIGMQYCAEILPTVVRAQGVAFIHIMGYVASILSPVVVYLSTIHESLPLWILGFVGIFGGSLALFLPETLGKDLPQTLDDGETFGVDQNFFDFPCIDRQRKSLDEVQSQPSTSKK